MISRGNMVKIAGNRLLDVPNFGAKCIILPEGFFIETIVFALFL